MIILVLFLSYTESVCCGDGIMDSDMRSTSLAWDRVGDWLGMEEMKI